MLETRIEEGVRRRAFEHFDVQSLHFELGDLTKSSDLIAKGNMTTGASAASRASATNTPEVKSNSLPTIEPLLKEEKYLHYSYQMQPSC